MSTPSLNAEKWLLPTVLLYCRRTLQHLTHAEISFCPRGCLIAFSLGLSCIVFSAFICITSDWATTDVGPVLLFHQLSCHDPNGVYFLGVITSWLVQCEYRALRIYIFALRGEVYAWHRTKYVFLVDFPVFWLSAQRSVIVPQLSLSTVLVWLVP